MPTTFSSPTDLTSFTTRLDKMLPNPQCELRHHDAWSLLAATILSAQSTDKRVNRITPGLFDRFPTVEAMAAAEPGDVEPYIRASGTYRQKAKRLVGSARAIVTHFDGKVPQDLDALTSLPGVARKTANLVLGIAYGLSTGIVVDTHVRRVADRLGLSQASTVASIEKDLMTHFPRTQWVKISHQLVLLGRYTCKARKPMCELCPVNEVCPSANCAATGTWQQRAGQANERIRSALHESMAKQQDTVSLPPASTTSIAL